jgi:hypothetical protein
VETLVNLKRSQFELQKETTMLSRKDCIIGVIATYGFLIMAFVVVEKGRSIETLCSYDDPCIRFCCKESKVCKESSIRENFNANLSFTKNDDFSILQGRPVCKLKDLGQQEDVKIFYVSEVYLREYNISCSTLHVERIH